MTNYQFVGALAVAFATLSLYLALKVAILRRDRDEYKDSLAEEKSRSEARYDRITDLEARNAKLRKCVGDLMAGW